jgi:hypothetical protein
VILQSASSCQACKKHLKFEPGAASAPAPSFSALALEGTVKHPNVGQAWEYSVLISVKNEKGEEVNRQVVGVGALQPGDQRSFTFAVEVFVPSEARAATPADALAATTSQHQPAAAASVPSGTRPGSPPPVPPNNRPPSPTPSVPSGTRPSGPSVPSGTRPRR